MSMVDDRAPVVPILAGLSSPRTGEGQLPGSYDSRMRLWMVNTFRGVQPIVQANATLVELMTKTKVIRETDDTGTESRMPELVTKTFVSRENDDQSAGRFPSLLELATKTETRRERDD